MPTSGTVTAIEAGVITVETAQGSVAVTTSAETSVEVSAESTTAAVATGLCVTAVGEADSSGTVAAVSLALSEKGEESNG